MKRVIKFRKWDAAKGIMIDGDSLAFEEYAPLTTLLSQEGIMQYTGLNDKNGTPVYDGDIVRLDDGDVSHHWIFWDEQEARWFDERLEDGGAQTAYDSFDWVMYSKVIGNIYENPDLLKS